jgi:hypothetical protein
MAVTSPGVRVGVGVRVLVGVFGVGVRDGVRVFVGVFGVGVLDGVLVFVAVLVAVGVLGVGVVEGVAVIVVIAAGVSVGIAVSVGVSAELAEAIPASARATMKPLRESREIVMNPFEEAYLWSAGLDNRKRLRPWSIRLRRTGARHSSATRCTRV